MKPRKKEKSRDTIITTPEAEFSDPPQKKRCLDGSTKLLAVEKYLKTEEIPKLRNSQDKQTFCRFAAKFQLFDDALYYVGLEGEVKRKVIFTKEDRIQVLKDCHEIPNTERHFGLSRTQKKLVQSFYWTEITDDVRKWVLSCPQCQTPKKSPYQIPVKKEMKLVKANEAWEIVGIDVIGPFTRTVSAMSYVCIATDIHTKFVVINPLPDKTPASVARALLKVVYTHGAPKKFLIDQNRKFMEKLKDGISELVQVEYGNSEMYHHSPTGHDATVEILIPEIIMYAQMGYQDNWDEYLPSITYAFNTTFTNVNNVTPFFMMFGRNPNHMGAIGVNGPTCKEDTGLGIPKASHKELYRTCIENMTKMHEKVVRNIRKSQIVQRNKPECFNLKVGKFFVNNNAGNQNHSENISAQHEDVGFDYFPPQDPQRTDPHESQTVAMSSVPRGFYNETLPSGSRTTSQDIKLMHQSQEEHHYLGTIPVMTNYHYQQNVVQYNSSTTNFSNHSQIS